MPPRSSEQVHTAVGQSITTNVWSEYALEGFSIAQVPSNQGLIPPSRVNQMLVLRITVEFRTVDAIGVTVMRSVAFLQLHHFLSLDLIVEANDGLAAGSDELGAIEGVIETVELLID